MAAEATQSKPFVDWAVAERSLEDQPQSGDSYVVAPSERGTLVGVVDGLGHGYEAAVAARIAVAELRLHVGDSLQALFERCHGALAKTRGAAITLCYFSRRGPSLVWAGVGNVEATVISGSEQDKRRTESVLLRGGTVGYRLPRIKDAEQAISFGDTVVVTTDGIRAGYVDKLPLTQVPRQIADWVLQGYRKGTDDALVLVARYTGDNH